MNYKLKKMLTNVRIIIMLVFLVFAIVAIHPSIGARGVMIRSVDFNSSASEAGIVNPKPTASPMSKERIIAFNNKPIPDLATYDEFISNLTINRTFTLTTTVDRYRITVAPLVNVTVLPELEEKIIEEIIEVNKTIDGEIITMNKTVNKTVMVNKTHTEVLGPAEIGLKVVEAPSTNLRKGLELQGGTRVLLQPETELEPEDMEFLIENMKQRLNIYGLSDLVVRQSTDLGGNQYIIVEIAGATEDEVKALLAKQGKFEAKIGDTVVFRGGSGDITHVCKTADCAGIDPNTGCSMLGDGSYICRFRFSISLKPEAAERQAAATADLKVMTTDENGNPLPKENHYLNETLDLFLDDKEVNSLNIGMELKGRAETEIAISGSGTGTTQEEAVYRTLDHMKQLQTVLITGSLPVKLNIVKTDLISASLGEEFVNSALMMGLIALLAVAGIVLIRYKQFKIAAPVIFVMISEIIILLGTAALIGWNLDLAAIAGILIAVGTGVDDQIVIVDETLGGESIGGVTLGWKAKLKNAWSIIFGAYMTTLVAMLPLLFAGAGLLKGFALTTIIGITFGVFITRPAFAAMIEIISK